MTITGHAGTDLTLTPTPRQCLTFTPSTWKRTQTVTVAAGDDGDALNDSALLTHRASGRHGVRVGYGGPSESR